MDNKDNNKNNNTDTLSALDRTIVEAIHERKGTGVTIVDMSGIEAAATGEFIIAEGRSPQQVAAIADSVREYVQEHSGVKPYNYDGYANAEWIVIDYGNPMVHIFIPADRERYNLEDLWADAKITNIPDLD